MNQDFSTTESFKVCSKIITSSTVKNVSSLTRAFQSDPPHQFPHPVESFRSHHLNPQQWYPVVQPPELQRQPDPTPPPVEG
ncbi:hypothetical protein K7X08_035135 [Anisodus acutangulus]|uniref:Uncharacterized protein n=1 Tax=Anisodus acutangulus TaxID=402998 RepID=A0A9Q1LKJ9_9SOLA|nr:hypothetical protein K7X08_035135 [Anisodus acutangulus]